MATKTTKKGQKKRKPKLAVYANHAIYVLINRRHMRHHYESIPPNQQAQFLSSDQQANESTLWGMNAVDFDHDQQKKLEKQYKGISKKRFRRACQAFCQSPDVLSDPRPYWLILLLSLLASVLDLFLPDLPSTPVIQLKNALSIPDALEVLLQAVHGPDLIKGKGCKLQRPACIRASVPLGAANPSQDPEDYIGGYANVNGAKRHLWLPLRCMAFALAANVPRSVQETIIGRSPLTIPIICSPTLKPKDRPLVFLLDGSPFQSVDPDMLKQLKRHRKITYLLIYCFTRWLRRKEKRQQKCRENASQFYPSTRNDRFVTTAASDEAKVIALALAVFKQFLHYASRKKGWITHEDAQSTLLETWTRLLPESAPKALSEAKTTSDAWDNPNRFWAFLARYLQENQQHISLAAPPCSPDIVAVTHQLPEGKFLIMPRRQLSQAYFNDLQSQNIILPSGGEKKWDTTLQRAILEWGIQAKTEGKDISWRYTLYDNQAPKNKRKLPCLAFPIDQLPGTIITQLINWFGNDFDPWISPTKLRNDSEQEKVTGNAEIGENDVG